MTAATDTAPQANAPQPTAAECKTALESTLTQLHHLDAEKATLLQHSKQREEEEEQHWQKFQTQYDIALKEKQLYETTLNEKDVAIIQLEHDQKKIVELPTNKETEEQLTKWQVKYDVALQQKDEVEVKLQQNKQHLIELRAMQSDYMKEREKEDAEMWREFQGRYDAALVEKKRWEDLVKEGEGGGVDVVADGVATTAVVADTSVLSKSNDDGVKQPVNNDDDEKVTTIASCANEIKMGNDGNIDSNIDEKKGELSNTTDGKEVASNNDDTQLNNDDRKSPDTDRASRAIEYKKDLSALDKFLGDDSSVVSGRSSRSVSNKSVRRRDVIKPIALDDQSDMTPRKAAEECVFVANMDGTLVEEPLANWTSNQNGNGDDTILEQSNPQCDQQFALVVHDPTQKPPRPTNLEPEEGRAALSLENDPPGESPTYPPYIDHNNDTINDSSSTSYLGEGGRLFRNVQWVDPKDAHDEDIDYSLLNAYERMSSRAVVNDQSLALQIVDPPSDLPKNNYYPEEDDSSSKARLKKASMLRDNKRIRIATISSGYKTANYFVREDLDTRIYFHELEDAINYMTRRGYARMKKEDEDEWVELIGKAHGVVKVGVTKKKQRFRKGKLVMILSKEINDNEEDEKPTHCDSSEVTERTSLGRSVRCGFRSYSEKFLAEQEAAKRSTLLQLTNGSGAAADGAADNMLPLTNGEALSAVDEDTLESSRTSMGSDRKGVYGGGVRYFTTDDDEYESHSSDEDEDGDDSDEEEVVEEEDNEAEEEEELDEKRGIHQDDEEEMQEMEGSMGSMFTDEDIYMDTRSAGVDSMSASSTLTSGYPESSQRKEKDRDPPQGLAPIDDE